MPQDQSFQHQRPGSTSPTVIELVPRESQPLLGGFFAFLRRTVLAVIALIILLILLRICGAAWLAGQFSDSIQKSADAGGWDASITAWLRQVAAWGVGFAAVGLFARMVLGLLVPVGSWGRASWKPLMVLMAVSGLGTLTPLIIQKNRGLGPDNLPAVMEEVDPKTSVWFSPTGEAQIFHADHLDGIRRFWNRPGHTPRDNTQAFPVTQRVYREWLMQEEAAELESRNRRAREESAAEEARRQEDRRQTQERAARAEEFERQRLRQESEKELARLRLEIEKAQAESAQAQREQAVEDRQKLELKLKQEEGDKAAIAERNLTPWGGAQAPERTGFVPAKQIEPQAPQRPVQTFFLPAGMTLRLYPQGDEVEVWTNGPAEVAADGGGFEFLAANRPMRFRAGFQTIFVRSSNPATNTVFIRPLE